MTDELALRTSQDATRGAGDPGAGDCVRSGHDAGEYEVPRDRAGYDLSGLLAGSMTNPPALAFASNITGSDAPTVAYATVYPLTTLLRILSAQVLAITLSG